MSSFGSIRIRESPTPKKKVCNFVGGVLSPLLANIALHGMEREVKAAMTTDLIEWYKSTGKRGRRDSLRSLTCVRYADDFIFAHHSKEIIEKLKPVVVQWLSGMGLTLKDSKTRTTHSLQEESTSLDAPSDNSDVVSSTPKRAGKHSSNHPARRRRDIKHPSKKPCG